MSTISTPATAWQWPPDVVEFARRNQIESYLDPLLKVLRDLFPTARSLKVSLQRDPEIHDLSFIRFEVRVSVHDVPDYLASMRRWHDESFRVCPAPVVCHFTLMLLREEP